MAKVKLDAKFVRNAVCFNGKKTDYYDEAITGFILEVRPAGGKTYAFRYRNDHGIQLQHRIGGFNDISFDKARGEAVKLRSEVTLNGNLSRDKKALRQVPTLEVFNDEKYIPYINLHRRNFQSTISFLKIHILPRFGQMHLDQITSAMISEAHQGMLREKYAPAMANKLPVIFKTMFNLAKKMEVQGASLNPANDIKLFPVNNEKERYLSSEETVRLHQALAESKNPQLKHIVALMLMFGFRKRELLDAKWEHLDLERGMWRIPVTKSGKPRTIPISPTAKEELLQLPRWKDCPYVIPNPTTLKPYGNLHGVWDTVRKRAGLADVRMHDLRHSFASNLVNSGQSIYVVGKLLGHSQVKTTQRYAHLSDATLQAAMNDASHAARVPGQDLQRASA